MKHSALVQFITQQIAQHPERRITFAQFMDWALYHPTWGYYASRDDRLGFQGDFVTAPHLAADFGELLAEQIVQLWQILEQPAPFTVLEMGAGRGILARTIVSYLQRYHPMLWAVLEYRIIERSPALIAEQQRQLAPFLSPRADGASPLQIQWCQWENIPDGGIVGCCLSNELVDAFPVHRVVITDGQLQECYVTTTTHPETPFTETIAAPSTPQLADYFAQLGINITRLPNGYCTEVNLAALDWLKTVASRLHRGYVLTVDYGYSADRYYAPTRRAGTLQCYYQHSYHNDPYSHVGEQDITAHVNFTALELWGSQVGLTKLGWIEQALFLMALGLGDRISALAGTDSTDSTTAQTLLRRRDALQTLINPMGMGNFGVLLQGKGLTVTQQAQHLRGFTIPKLSDANLSG